MDKQEYQEFLDEITLSYYRKNYELVAAYADDIILKKIKDNKVLELIADSYAKQEEYNKAADVLKLLYERTGSKKHAYMLSEMCIAADDLDGAVDYYDEFVRLAPKDSSRLILKYEIGRAGNIKTEDLIRVLEEYSRREKDDRWEFELAKMYHEAGMADKCVETCDDIILWFSDGEYVKEALKLKSMHTTLTNEQQIRYEELLTRALHGENAEISADASAAGEEPGLDDAAEKFASEYLGEEPDRDVYENTEKYNPEIGGEPVYGSMIYGRDASREDEPSDAADKARDEDDEPMQGTFGAKTHTSSIDDTRFIPIDLLRDKIRYPAADIRDMREDYGKQQDITEAAAQTAPEGQEDQEDPYAGAGDTPERDAADSSAAERSGPENPEESADPVEDIYTESTDAENTDEEDAAQFQTAKEDRAAAQTVMMAAADETAAGAKPEPVFGHPAHLNDVQPEKNTESIGATQIFRMPKEKTAAEVPSAPALDTGGSGKKSTEITLDELRKILKPSQVRNGEFGFFFDMSPTAADNDDNEINIDGLLEETQEKEPEQEEKTVTVKVSKSTASKLGMAFLQLSPLASMVRKPDLDLPPQELGVSQTDAQDTGFGAKLSDNVDVSGFPILNGDDGQIDLNLDLLAEEEPDIEGQMTLSEVFAEYQEKVRQNKEHISQIEADRLKKIQDEVNASFVPSKMYDLDDDAIDMVYLDESDLSGENVIFRKTEEPENAADMLDAAVAAELAAADAVVAAGVENALNAAGSDAAKAGSEPAEQDAAGTGADDTEIPVRIRTYAIDNEGPGNDAAGAAAAADTAGNVKTTVDADAADVTGNEAAAEAGSEKQCAAEAEIERTRPGETEINAAEAGEEAEPEETGTACEAAQADIEKAGDTAETGGETVSEEILPGAETTGNIGADDAGTGEAPEQAENEIISDDAAENVKPAAPVSFTMELRSALAGMNFDTGSGADFTGSDGEGAQKDEPSDEEMQELDNLFEDIDSDLEIYISRQLQTETRESEMSDAEKAIAAFLAGEMGSRESEEIEDAGDVSEEDGGLDDILNALFEEDDLPGGDDGEGEALPDSDIDEENCLPGDDLDEEISDYSEYDNDEGRELDSITLPENNDRPSDVIQERPAYQLTDTIRKEISEFLLIDGMEEQFVKAVDTISGKKIKGDTSGGNLIIAGDAKSGKTYLAVEIVKAVTEDTGVGTGKVATVQAEALNGKDIDKVFAKINGNDLVIENVGYLEDGTIQALERNIRNNTSDGMVIFEGNQIAIDNILRNFPELEELFRSRINLSELSIVEWAEVAKDYAGERGYKLDDMAVLSLHAKINEANVPTRRLGYESVVKIVDDAIAKAEKRNVGKLFSAFSKKDGGGLKELTEADFM